MTRGRLVRWNGRRLGKLYVLAARLAVDQTTSAAVVHAKTHHEFVNRTGVLEGSLMMRTAKVVEGIVTGQWGSYGVIYALYVELGWTRRRNTYTLKQISRMFDDLFSGDEDVDAGGVITSRARPFLRPAADAENKHLARRLARLMKEAARLAGR